MKTTTGDGPPGAAEGPIRAVLFDYGLTLVTFEFPRRALLDVLEAAGPEIEAATGRPAPAPEQLMATVLEPIEAELESFGQDEVTDYLGFYRAGWRRAGLDLQDPLLLSILDREQLCWDRAVEVAPGALALLRRLRERGLRTVIASNAPFPGSMMRRQMATAGLLERVDAVVLSSEVGRRKPAPELYQAALAAAGCPPGQAIHVGDRLREDFEGPRAAGIRAVICTALAREPVPAGVPAIGCLEELEMLL